MLLSLFHGPNGADYKYDTPEILEDPGISQADDFAAEQSGQIAGLAALIQDLAGLVRRKISPAKTRIFEYFGYSTGGRAVMATGWKGFLVIPLYWNFRIFAGLVFLLKSPASLELALPILRLAGTVQRQNHLPRILRIFQYIGHIKI